MNKSILRILFLGVVILLFMDIVFDVHDLRFFKRAAQIISDSSSLDMGDGRLLSDYHDKVVSFLKEDSAKIKIGFIRGKGDEVIDFDTFPMRRAVLFSNHTTIEIRNISDMLGYVWIDTPEKALEYVLLFASHNKMFFMEDSPVFSPYLLVSDANASDGRGLSVQGAEDIGYFPPKTEEIHKAFIIERFVVDYQAKTGDILKVIERVAYDGTYTVVSVTMVKAGVITNWGLVL